MRYKLIYILLLLTFCVGCEKTWDDHYGHEDDPRVAAASLTAWEALNTMPEKYSKFITLIKRAGYDKALDSERMLTVWAPEDKYISDEVMAYDSLSPEVVRFVTNHLNSLALFKTKIVGREEIKTLARKVMKFAEYYDPYTYDERRYEIDGMHIYRFDLACTNGVIHEIAGVLIPLKNLSEFLMESGDEYQLFRDSMSRRNDTIFRVDLSFPIGVNDLGQTVYDSIFDIENSLLVGLELHDESTLRTLCLPSNDVIHEAFKVIKEYMNDINRPFTALDSANCFKWIMQASVLSGKRDDYSFSSRYYSEFGAEIRPAKQLVKSKYEECSNGNVFIFEDLYIPKSIFMYPVETAIVNFLEVDPKVNEAENLWQSTGVFRKFIDKGTEFLEVGGATSDYLEFSPIRLNIYSEAEKIKLMPGKYAVYAQFHGWTGAASTTVKINGESQKWYKDGSFTFPTATHGEFEYTTFPLMIDTLNIEAHHGFSEPVIRISAATDGFIRIQRMKFQEVGIDNY